MNRIILPAALVAGALALAACASSTATYKTASAVIEALNKGGMTIQCDHPDSGAGQAVVAGAVSENQCYPPGSTVSFLVDVFPGTVSRATLMANSVSTGDEPIVSVLGSNWWVETDGGHAHQVQKILGGTIVQGIWHPDTGN